MARITRRTVLGALGAQACGAVPQVTSPAPFRVVWDLAKAHRQATATRERVSINGLWRWRPANAAENVVPADGWGHLGVPESWPVGQRRAGATLFYPHESWSRQALNGVTAAWYQRDITVPAGWTGRRITLSADYLNSYAAVYLDGVKAGEIRYPAGELDLTALCKPGQTHLLSLLVIAMPLKAVMQSFSDTASARTVEGNVQRKGLCGDVWLNGTPAGARISGVRVETSVRNWQIALDAALEGLDPQAAYRLRARIADGKQIVNQFTSAPFRGRDLTNGRIRLSEPGHPQNCGTLTQFIPAQWSCRP